MLFFKSKKDQSKICPYCGYIFEAAPKRKRDCPECKKTIYIQKEKDELKLITEIHYKENNTLSSLGLLGITPKQYFNYKEIFFNKLGEKANYNDFLWSIYNNLLNENAKDNNFNRMKLIYKLMAEVVKDKKPDQYIRLLKESMSMDLLQWKSFQSVKEIQILAAVDSCETCKADNEKIVKLDQAIEEKILPHKDCSHKYGCRCMYIVPLADKH